MKEVEWQLPSFVDDIACMAISSGQDEQRAMKKADKIMEEEGEKAGITFDKGKEEDISFNGRNTRAGEKEKVRRLGGWLDPNLSSDSI